MVNVDFNHPIVTPNNDPYLDDGGHSMTLGQAAAALLTAYVPPNILDARIALDLAEQITRNDPLLSVMAPSLRVLEAAVNANAARLPAIALAQLARRLGFKGLPS